MLIEGHVSCIFCEKKPSFKIIYDSNDVYAIFDEFAVSRGHVLIIPKVHQKNWFDLSLSIQTSMIKALSVVKEQIDQDYRPDGYNIGINCGKFAGQTVMHVHLHLIPRYNGDVPDPTGGIRSVIPDKKIY